jgi:FkbM family methyltransferase
MTKQAGAGQKKIRVAIVKFAGMTIGGSELWLQKIAANLPKDRIAIDFYYCDDTPYIGATHAISPNSPERIEYLKQNGINVIPFKVGAKNVRTPVHKWVDTDFWEKFDATKYDLVQTVKAGPKEYPFYEIPLPVVEIVALALRPDKSKNIAWSFHSSSWQRARWVRMGGSVEKSSVLTAPVELPLTSENYRAELGIPATAIVAGFHQRASNDIASAIPLSAFSEIQKKYPKEATNWHFIIKNGGSFYRDQAKELSLKNIHFLPQTADSTSVSKFLNTLDIFAHGRKDGETFGAILVEAMLHNLPCLSHWTQYANAQPETMGPAGLFAETPEEYSSMLDRLFSDYEFRKKLASKAGPHAREYYSMERCLSQIMGVYEKIGGGEISNKKTSAEPIPYGYSDMGFLYAGDMNKKYNIAYHVLVGGIPEAFDVAIVRSLLPGTNTFIDIGANTGIYCWVAADYYAKHDKGNGKVIAFEPQPDCALILNKTIYLNNWESIASVKKIGLGAQPGTLKLQVCGTGSSVVPNFLEPGTPSIEIEIDTVDRVTEKENIKKIDFIKIDVEGHELEVLKGAANGIEKDKPIIFVEIAQNIHSRNYVNANYQKTLSWIIERGYRIWISENNTLKEISVDHHHKDGVAMYLCLHPQKHADKIAGLADTVLKYRSENLLLGLVEKRKIQKIIQRVVPPYINMANIKRYLLRLK